MGDSGSSCVTKKRIPAEATPAQEVILESYNSGANLPPHLYSSTSGRSATEDAGGGGRVAGI